MGRSKGDPPYVTGRCYPYVGTWSSDPRKNARRIVDAREIRRGRGKQREESHGMETGRAPDKPEVHKLESRASVALVRDEHFSLFPLALVPIDHADKGK